MNRIISINIKGLIFQIEEDAFERLNGYLQKLKAHFRDQSGSDEILDDIETRIAEMLSRDPGPDGSVGLNRVNEIIRQMGDPAEFDDAEETTQTYSYSGKRKLYRDTDNKMIGGVCSGMGAYFDFDPLWIRILFLFAFFTFGTGLLLYIILWVLIPEARTPSERLEMRGEKVTIDSIEKTVKEEFDRIKKNFNDGSIKNGAKQVMNTAGTGIQYSVKALLYILLRVVGFFLILGSLFALIFISLAYFGLILDAWHTPFFPFFNQLFDDSILAILFKVSCILLVLIPLFGLLYSGVRLLLGFQKKNQWIGRSLGSLWFLSLIGVVAMAFTLAHSWRDHATLSEEQVLQQTDTLYIESGNPVIYGQKEYVLEFGHSRGIRGIYAMENDSLKRPVKLNIQPVNTGQLILKQHRHSNGPDYEASAQLASNIQHNLRVTPGKLHFNPYYAVPESDVWRNQQLIYDLYVPVGTVIVFGKNTSTFLSQISTESYIHNSNLEGKAFRMSENGLAIKESDNEPSDDGGINYAFRDFDEIEINAIPQVMVYYSPEYSVSTSSDCNFGVRISKDGNRLQVSLPESELFSKGRGLLRIGTPSLHKIQINGGSTVSLNIRKQDAVEVVTNGSNKIEGTVMMVKKLTLESNGLNTCKLSGHAGAIDLEASGAGEINLKDLATESADIESNGGAIVAVRAIHTLNAESNGFSKITYYGNPANTKLKSNGGSSIIKGAD